MTLNALDLSARTIGALAAGVALMVVLAGCGGDDAATDSAADATSAAAGGAPAGAPRGLPGTSGEIAAVDDDVLQVRSQMTGQVAVTVTDATAVIDQAAGTLADVETGVCVVVRSAATDEATAGDGVPPAEVDAATVSVLAAGDDGCDVPDGFGGGPGGGGEPPAGMPTDLPTDVPSGMPRGGGPMGGFGASGEVTSVTSTGFVVAGVNGDVTVTVADDTTYTRQVASDAAALTVGRCVRVMGEADDAGAVTAESIQVSDAGDDQCGR